jgi:hypothetical protein
VSKPDDPPTTTDTPLRCDCGYLCNGETVSDRVKDGQRHAREAHSIEVSADQVLNQATQ